MCNRCIAGASRSVIFWQDLLADKVRLPLNEGHGDAMANGRDASNSAAQYCRRDGCARGRCHRCACPAGVEATEHRLYSRRRPRLRRRVLLRTPRLRYAKSAVCSATRLALITGRYQYRLRLGLEEPWAGNADIGLPPDHPTLPSLLKKTGYGTSLIGKWHLGALPKFGPLQSGYDHFFGFRGGTVDY